jgi:SAM-dependent methyltransferase
MPEAVAALRFVLRFSAWLVLSTFLVTVLMAVGRLLATGEVRMLGSWSSFTAAWFGVLRSLIGPGLGSESAGMPYVMPLLEGRVSQGRLYRSSVVPALHGTVLDVGAGSGNWMDAFLRVVRGEEDRAGVRPPLKIYGIEPNANAAAALRQSVEAARLGDVYEVVPVGIQDLCDSAAWGRTIAPGTVDCIVTVQSLCSIPNPEKNVALLYRYLRKGGHWYVFEHVQTDRGIAVKMVQSKSNRFKPSPTMAAKTGIHVEFINLVFWKHVSGGCSLCRNTRRTLSQVATWDNVDLAQPPRESQWSLVPHIIGTLRK